MALRKLEEGLSCSICLDTYTDPKELQCHHIFCRVCLVRLVVRNKQGQLTLACPTCRQVMPIPANGTTGLKSAFHINHLLELRDSLSTIEVGAVGGSPDLNSVEKVSYCSEHSKKGLELYCETCGELVCLKCVIKGGKHHNHDCKELAEAFERYKGEITVSLEPMEKQLAVISKALVQLDICCRDVAKHQEGVEANIHVTVERLHETLNVRKAELITKLDEITQAKLKDLAVQRDQLETIQAQLSSCLDFTRESLRTGSHGEVLGMRTAIAEQVEELTTTLQPAMLEPNAEADMIFSVTADITTACQNYGRVVSEPDPSKFHAEGEGLKTAVVGETSIIDCHGNFKSRLLECEIVSEITGADVRSVIQKRRPNLNEITYQPTIQGKHQLHIKVSGHHIRGSPFTVAVKSPVEKLGNPIAIINKVSGSGAAFNQKGELVIAQSTAVSVLSLNGKILHSFGSRGSGQGEFSNPQGVAVDKRGNIFVADSGNHRIQKFTAKGEFLAAVGTRGSGHLQFETPYDIAINASNNKVYVVDARHRVQVLNSDLTFSSIFGEQGSGKGQFDYPYGIACDSTGKVYVADGFNNRIQVFTAEGRFLRMFGRWGGGRGELKCPTFIAVDANNVVYVCDSENYRISVFTSEGQFISSFGRKGEKRGEFTDNIGGVAVDDDNGIVCVCDRKAKCIQLF